jgi:hypothetical protein
MIRKRTVDFLRGQIKPGLWEFVWWIPSVVAIVLLPLGTLFFQLMSVLGFSEPRAVQLLFLVAIFYGAGIGITTLLLIDKAELSVNLLSRAKWLARFAVVTPLLTLLILFWIFSRP